MAEPFDLSGVIASAQLAADLAKALIPIRNTSNAKIAEVTIDLGVQLEMLSQILIKIDKQGRNPTPQEEKKLGERVVCLQQELTALQALVAEVEAVKAGKSVISRAKLALRGFDKQFALRLERIEDYRTRLAMHVTDPPADEPIENFRLPRAQDRLNLRDLLQPCGRDFIPKKLNGTLEWVRSHPAVATWCRHPPAHESDRVLCIYGPRGCGKSVLSASIADSLAAENCVSAFFSFWHGDETQKRLEGMGRTILWQLLAFTSEDVLQSIREQLRQKLPLDSDHVFKHIASVLAAIDSPVYLVIDGIDESADDWHTADGGGLQIITNWISNHPKIHIALLGRESGFQGVCSIVQNRLAISGKLIKGDLSRLIAFELSRSPNLEAPAIRKLVCTALEENCNGMFLWVSLFFKELRGSSSLFEIQSTLETIHTELDREYHRLFARLMRRAKEKLSSPSSHSLRTKSLLGIIIGASCPLSIAELQHAYEIHHRPDTNEVYANNLITEEEIVDACGNFIGISDGKIHLVHASVEEFLTRPADQWQVEDSEIEFFRLSRRECQLSMGHICIKTLQSLDWNAVMMASNNSLRVEPSTILLAYSSSNWCDHFLESGGLDSNDAKEILRFIKSPAFCGWIEYSVSGAMCDLLSEAPILVGFVTLLRQCEDVLEEIESIFNVLVSTFDVELEKRVQQFGSSANRTQDWQSITDIIYSLASPLFGVSLPRALNDDPMPLESQKNVHSLIIANKLDLRQLSNLSATSKAIMGLHRLFGSLTTAFDPLERLFTYILHTAANSPTSFLILVSMYYQSFQQYEKAEKILSLASRRVAGSGSGYESIVTALMGTSNFGTKQYDLALANLSRAEEIAVSSRMPYFRTVVAGCRWGTLRSFYRQGRYEEVILLTTEFMMTWDSLKCKAGRNPRSWILPLEEDIAESTHECMELYKADSLRHLGRHAEAEPILLNLSSAFRNSMSLDHWMRWKYEQNLVGVRLSLKKWKEGEADARFLRDAVREHHGPHHRRTVKMTLALGTCITELGKFGEAEAELGEVVGEIFAGAVPLDDRGRNCVELLLRIYREQGKTEEEKELRKKLVVRLHNPGSIPDSKAKHDSDGPESSREEAG